MHMRFRVLSGPGIELAFLLLYTYSDTVRSFIDYLVTSIFHIAPQDTQGYVVSFAVVLLIISVSIGILDYLNLDILTPLKESITKTKVEQPHAHSLEAEIFGEKENRFLVGGTVCFKARYRGSLKNGYFTTKIRPQELHTILDTGSEHEWLVDYNTNVGIKKGNLNGLGSGWPRKFHKSVWGHKIPFMYPPGKYTATLMVFDDTSPDRPLDMIPLTFTVLDEELLRLRGWTKEGKEIPAPRSMFVKKPRRRSWLGTLR
jgi:hypothetical protein